MEIIRVEIRDRNALGILQNLELANLIKIIPQETRKTSLSKKIRGSLSKEKAEDLGKQLKTNRY